ncbi:MAG: hypothetical protein HGA55_07860 [Methanoregulaceae archaeon]|nr:hypothetical protein [Methanoregulaceae archaeon]
MSVSALFFGQVPVNTIPVQDAVAERGKKELSRPVSGWEAVRPWLAIKNRTGVIRAEREMTREHRPGLAGVPRKTIVSREKD